MILAAMALTALVGTQQPASPTSAESADQATIVVTGNPNVEDSIRDFVNALTALPPRGQLSRFERAVCPIALGLPKPQAEMVADRMRVVADAVGLRIGGGTCASNVVVAVTADKRVFLQELRRRHPDYFDSLTRRGVRELLREPGPASAWHLKGPPVSARGVELHDDPGLGAYVNRTTEPASRLHSAARPQFEAAMVVIERGVLDGLTTRQLADYAAMRAFANAKPPPQAISTATTILGVLEAPMDSEVPASLTEWDLAFLRGFYSSPRNLTNASQRSSIRKNVEKELDRSAGE